MTCYYQSQPGVRGYRQRLHAFWKEKRVVSSRRAKVVWSYANDSKERLAVTPTIRGDEETSRKWWKLCLSSITCVKPNRYWTYTKGEKTTYCTELGRQREKWRNFINIDKLRQYWHSRETNYTWKDCWANEERQPAKYQKPKKNW